MVQQDLYEKQDNGIPATQQMQNIDLGRIIAVKYLLFNMFKFLFFYILSNSTKLSGEHILRSVFKMIAEIWLISISKIIYILWSIDCHQRKFACLTHLSQSTSMCQISLDNMKTIFKFGKSTRMRILTSKSKWLKVEFQADIHWFLYIIHRSQKKMHGRYPSHPEYCVNWISSRPYNEEEKTSLYSKVFGFQNYLMNRQLTIFTFLFSLEPSH